MYNNISTKYKMKLLKDIEKKLWEIYKTYKEVQTYIELAIPKIQVEEQTYCNRFEYIDKPKYEIKTKINTNDIDLYSTIKEFDNDLLFQIAVDIGIEIPDIVYCIPEIKGILSSNYETAFKTFESAYSNLITNPDLSITQASSSLESIIKHIIKEPEILKKISENEILKINKKTLYKLTEKILQIFEFFPNNPINTNIRSIGSSLLNLCQNIESLRSENSLSSHGKTKEDYIIDDPIYSKLIVNCVSTIGLFLINFYEKKYKIKIDNLEKIEDTLPF